MTSIFEESQGVRSSKRVAGITSASLGAAVLLAVAIAAMTSRSPMPNAQIAVDVGKFLFGAGLLLLGVTVFEHFAK